MEDPNPLKVFQNDKSSVVNINDGKLPPQAISLEEAVIGAMLIDEKGVDEVIEILIPEVFYKKSHQIILTKISTLTFIQFKLLNIYFKKLIIFFISRKN